ncbi:MAG: hypothetical protein VX835_03480 [Pseudomonadota bacterium]|nr:hypothetical protein [Pseudomonadota bacterium]
MKEDFYKIIESYKNFYNDIFSNFPSNTSLEYDENKKKLQGVLNQSSGDIKELEKIINDEAVIKEEFFDKLYFENNRIDDLYFASFNDGLKLFLKGQNDNLRKFLEERLLFTDFLIFYEYFYYNLFEISAVTKDIDGDSIGSEIARKLNEVKKNLSEKSLEAFIQNSKELETLANEVAIELDKQYNTTQHSKIQENFKKTFKSLIVPLKDYSEERKNQKKLAVETFFSECRKIAENIQNVSIESMIFLECQCETLALKDASQKFLSGQSIDQTMFDHLNKNIFFNFFQFYRTIKKDQPFETQLMEFMKQFQFWFDDNDPDSVLGINLNTFIQLNDMDLSELKDEYKKDVISLRKDFFVEVQKIYKGLGNQENLKKNVYQSVQEVNQFIQEKIKKEEFNKNDIKTSFYKSHFGQLFNHHIARFSINHNPNENNAIPVTFKTLTEHLQNNLPSQSCNPAYVYKWHSLANDEIHNRILSDLQLRYSGMYHQAQNKHFYIALSISIISTLGYLALYFNMLSPIFTFECFVATGIISLIYSQFIINNDTCQKIFKNLKSNLKSYNVWSGFNCCTLIMLMLAASISIVFNASTISTITLLFYISSLSSSFATFLNQYFSYDIIKNRSIEEASPLIEKEFNSLHLNSLFTLDPNSNEIIFTEDKENFLYDSN